jgi:hypothetical protein
MPLVVPAMPVVVVLPVVIRALAEPTLTAPPSPIWVEIASPLASDCTEEPVWKTLTVPLPVLLASMAAPLVASTASVPWTVRSPAPMVETRIPSAPETRVVLLPVEPAVTVTLPPRLSAKTPLPPVAPAVRLPPSPATFCGMSARVMVMSEAWSETETPLNPPVTALFTWATIGLPAPTLASCRPFEPTPPAAITPLSMRVIDAPAPLVLLTSRPVALVVMMEEAEPRVTVSGVGASGVIWTVPVALKALGPVPLPRLIEL